MANIKPSEVVDYRGLETYTNLIQQHIDKANRESIDAFTDAIKDTTEKVEKTFAASSSIYGFSQIKEQVANAIESKRVDIDYSLINNWDYLTQKIYKIPIDYFVMPRNPNNDRYPLPKPYISWSDNVAEAYDFAMQIQDTIIYEGGIQSQIYPNVKYKGFYVVEYSLDAIAFDSNYNQWYLTAMKRTSSALHADAYMLNVTYEGGATGFIEWTEEEKADPNNTQKNFYFQLAELPKNGKLFMTALFEEDNYTALVRNSGAGKVLLIGGHPTYINIQSDSRFDEGIIQINKTGEPSNINIPKDAENTDCSVYVLVNDYNYDEENKNLSISCKYYTSNDPNEVGTSIEGALTYDASTKYWYYVFDAYGAITSISDVSIFDNGYGNSSNNMKRCFYSLSPKKSYPIVIDTDGYDVEPGASVHGTDYYINYPITNQIYLRQFKGAFDFITNSAHSYVDKIHLTQLNEHGITDSGATETAWLLNTGNNTQNSNVFELELPNFEYLYKGGLVSRMDKLHALYLPKFRQAQAPLAYNCNGLLTINAPELESTTSYLASDCTRLVNVKVPKLKSTSGTILNNGSYTRLNFERLETCSGPTAANTIVIYGPFLEEVNYGHDVSIVDNGAANCYMYKTNAETLTVNFLGNNTYSGVGGLGTLTTSANCTTFTSSTQTFVDCNANGSFYNNALLEEVYMPSVHNIVGSGKAFASCPKMKRITFGRIDTMSNVSFCDSSCLIYVMVGEGTQSDLFFGNWNPSLALSTSDNSLINIGETTDNLRSNLYRFLYNFRANIIDHLKDYTGGTTHKIYLHANVKEALTTSEAATTYIFPTDTEPYATVLDSKLSAKNWQLA